MVAGALTSICSPCTAQCICFEQAQDNLINIETQIGYLFRILPSFALLPYGRLNWPGLVLVPIVAINKFRHLPVKAQGQQAQRQTDAEGDRHRRIRA